MNNFPQLKILEKLKYVPSHSKMTGKMEKFIQSVFTSFYITVFFFNFKYVVILQNY